MVHPQTTDLVIELSRSAITMVLSFLEGVFPFTAFIVTYLQVPNERERVSRRVSNLAVETQNRC